jgi:DNA-3-methyladenine glycosylase
MKILKRDFFDRSAVIVAKDLIGKYLVRSVGGKTERFLINETEAYEGLSDKASHASRGQTVRNTPMFLEPGTIYVYFTYGMHWMLNITCGKKGYPAAVLIRGAGEYNGPAKLTKGLRIDKTLNGKVFGKKSGLWIEDKMEKNLKIKKTPRIGVSYAGPVWSNKLYRFVVEKK